MDEKKEVIKDDVLKTVTQANAHKGQPKPEKAKPRIVGLIEYRGSVLVATETTIYMKYGELLTPVKWQVPD